MWGRRDTSSAAGPLLRQYRDGVDFAATVRSTRAVVPIHSWKRTASTHSSGRHVLVTGRLYGTDVRSCLHVSPSHGIVGMGAKVFRRG